MSTPTVAELMQDAQTSMISAAGHVALAKKAAATDHEKAEKEYVRAANAYLYAADKYWKAGDPGAAADAYEQAGLAFEGKALINYADDKAGLPGEAKEAANAFTSALECFNAAKIMAGAANDNAKEKGMKGKIDQIEKDYGVNGKNAQYDLPGPNGIGTPR